MKKRDSHYCRICQQYKANEKFSGRGHAKHVCKACAKRGNKPPEIEPEPTVIIDEEDLDIFDIDLDVILHTPEEEPPKPKKKRKPSKAKLLRAAQKKEAKAFLLKTLANGEMTSVEVQKAAVREGISIEALRRAKGSLKIHTAATESGNVWKLP